MVTGNTLELVKVIIFVNMLPIFTQKINVM